MLEPVGKACMLPPLGDTVPEWGAKRVLAHAARGTPVGMIAGMLGTSVSTVERIIAAGGQDGTARVPQQGKGKKSDPRWVYSGHMEPGMLAALEGVMEQGPCDELKQEVYSRWLRCGVGGGSYRRMCHVLLHKLDYTTKRLTTEAHERDDLRCKIWFNRTRTRFSASQLICVDESTADSRLRNRRVGISKRGKRAGGKTTFFHHGVRHSILAPFDLSEGFLDVDVVEGGYNADRFLDALYSTVFPHMTPFPGPRSVLVLDGASIHKSPEVLDAVHRIGCLVLFLEPYDPQHMPIEQGFMAVKDFYRKNRELLEALPVKTALLLAVRSVNDKVGRAAFHECGYI